MIRAAVLIREVLCCLLVFSAVLKAQSGTGEISGIVTDATGAAIPRAAVRIQNEGNGQSKTLSTDDQGRYSGLDLLVGTYTVDITASGFKEYKRTGVVLVSTDHVAVNVVLEVGALAEKVEVVAAAAQIETLTAQNNRVVESELFLDMPLNGRNETSMMVVKAGVISTSAPDAFRPTNSSDARSYYILGSRAEGQNLTLDGVTMLTGRNGMKGAEMVSVDAVQEANIITNSYTAEFARAGSGQVQFITRSGTKGFHGTLFEYLRNNDFDARSFQSATVAKNSYNQYGFSLGGPVFIPRVFNTGREKLFFFANTEFVNRRAQNLSNTRVPTALERSGNFNGSPLFACPKDASSGGTPFPGCVLPASRLSSNGTAVLNLYPLPNVVGQPNYNLSRITPSDEDARTSTFRVDYYWGRQRLFWRGMDSEDHPYSWAPTDFPTVPEDGNLPGRSTAVALTSVVSPNRLNSFRAGAILRNDAWKVQGPAGSSWQSYSRAADGINYPYLFPGGKELYDKIPDVIATNLPTITGSAYPAHCPNFTYQVQDDFSWIHGGHAIKFGAYLEYVAQNNNDEINISTAPGSGSNQNGTFRFAASPGNPFTTGNTLADLMIGRFDSYSEIGPKSYTLERVWSREFYVQDSWKVSSRVSLELGLRYANWPPEHALWGNFAMFDPSFYDPKQAVQVSPSTGLIVAGTGNLYNGMVLPGNAFPASAAGHVQFYGNPAAASLFHGLPNSISTADENMWQPRFGLAWDVTGDGTTSIRVGSGIYNSRYYFSDALLMGGNPPLQQQQVVTNGSMDNPGGTSVAPLYPLSVTMQDPHIRQSVTYTTSLNVQHRMPAGFVLEVGYVSNLSRHLPSAVQLEQLAPGTLQANKGVNAAALMPYAGYSSITYYGNRATSNFNGMTATMQRRFHNGLMFEAAYTFSRSIDDASDKRDLAMITNNLSADRGLSTFDREQVLVFTYVYDVPFFKSSSLRLLRPAFAGWRLSGITVLESGLPTTVNVSGDPAGVSVGGTERSSVVGDGTLPRDQRTFYHYFNTAAFVAPAAGTFGNSGRHNLRLPGTNSWDLAVSKRFPIGEKKHVQVRGDFFDIPNHLSYSGFGTTIGSASYGIITGALPTRVIQVSARVEF